MPKAPKLWPPGPLNVTRYRLLPTPTLVVPSPVPSIDTKRSILPFSSTLNRCFVAAQVAEPLLADVGDEGDRSRRRDLRLLQQPDDADEHGQAAAVVADARSLQHGALARDLDVGLFGEHRVEVRGDDQMRARLRPGPLAEHVALAVDAHVLQPELLERPLEHLGPRCSLNGGAGTSQMRICSSTSAASRPGSASARPRRPASAARPRAEVGRGLPSEDTSPTAIPRQAATSDGDGRRRGRSTKDGGFHAPILPAISMSAGDPSHRLRARAHDAPRLAPGPACARGADARRVAAAAGPTSSARRWSSRRSSAGPARRSSPRPVCAKATSSKRRATADGYGGSIEGLGDFVDARRECEGRRRPSRSRFGRPSAGGAKQTIEVTPGPGPIRRLPRVRPRVDDSPAGRIAHGGAPARSAQARGHARHGRQPALLRVRRHVRPRAAGAAAERSRARDRAARALHVWVWARCSSGSS